ncbi:hypothetical protein DPMN_168883 [Dreissena polymorpha]|uniref:Uncharacterized protein n=1 Tax=Dreissena polymorpha TaxID=45954 RepID=A0A9D4F2P6_DREPO|nr:hypothetical protein DPMN_168883 [Dreissena polymorpha]
MIDNALKRVSTLCLELQGEPSRIATRNENIDKQLNKIKLLIDDAFESLRSSVKKAFMEEKSKILRSSEATLSNETAKKTDILKKKEELDGVLSYGDEVQKYLYMLNQASGVDAKWQIEFFTQKRIVLDNKMQPSLLNIRLENESLIPQEGRMASPPKRPPPIYKNKHTLLEYVLGEIKNLVEVKQEICK